MILDIFSLPPLYYATIEALHQFDIPYEVDPVTHHIVINDADWTPNKAWSVGAYSAMAMDGRTGEPLPKFPFNAIN